MDELTLETEQKMVTCRYLVVDGKRYSPGSVIDALEQLESCDGMFSSLVIYDDDLGKMLVAQGAAAQTTKGGYRAGDNRQTFLDKVEAALMGSHEQNAQATIIT